MIARSSAASLYIETQAAGLPLSSATGFAVRRGSSVYLITNRHVLRGRRQDDDQPMHASAAIPETVTIVFKRATAPGRLSWDQKQESLLDHQGRPRWHEHPALGGRVDVVALPLSDLGGVDLLDYDPWDSSGPAIACGPSDVLSIIGFPFGRTAGGFLAIWVAGSIASEPAVDFNGLPSFLIDSRTREGQSGSPVIAYRSGGMVPLEDGSVAAYTGPVQRFLGVYSGRISKESDLGIVWKASVVRDIIDGAGNTGASPPAPAG